MKKKANMLDLIWLMPLLLILFVVAIVGMKAYNSYYDSVNSTLSPQARQITTTAGGAVESYDYILLIFYFGLFLAVIISAMFIQSHPMFFFASLLLLVISVFLAAPFANAYLSFKDDPSLSTEIASLTMSGYILEYLPLFIAVMGVIVIVALYVKISGGRGPNV